MVEVLPSKHKALGLIPITEKKKWITELGLGLGSHRISKDLLLSFLSASFREAYSTIVHCTLEVHNLISFNVCPETIITVKVDMQHPKSPHGLW